MVAVRSGREVHPFARCRGRGSPGTVVRDGATRAPRLEEDPMTTTTTPATGTDRTARRLAGVLAAPVAALAAHLVLTQGLDIELRAGGRTVGWSSVLIAAVVAGSAGWLVVAGLERLGGNQRRRWSMLSLVVLALSLPGPLLEGETPVVGLGLVALH